jgi:serine O-acetyltransferase
MQKELASSFRRNARVHHARTGAAIVSYSRDSLGYQKAERENLIVGLLRSDLIAFADELSSPESTGFSRTAQAVLTGASNPGIHAVILYRIASGLHRRGLGPLAAIVSLFNVFLTSADIDQRAEFGPGLRIYHPVGVVVHRDARVGARARLFSDVVFGLRGPKHEGAPTAGDDLRVGSGAKLLGNIKIGDRVSIGANAVVLHDVPDDHLAIGVPARNVAVTDPARED